MIKSSSFSIYQRDRYLLISSLSVVVLLAWFYLYRLYENMPDMQTMTNMPMGIKPWTLLDFSMMLLMWVIMMIGMMVPTAMRSVMIYSQIVSKARSSGKSVASTYYFVSGYIVVWSLFSIAATVLQWFLESRALVSPMMVSTSSYLGAGLLISAGIYQLTPLKEVCLKHCQSPAEFIANNYKKGALGAFQIGFNHGAYCLGCCWVIMGLLFVGGVMNLLWILAISLFVLLEKLLPSELQYTRITSLIMIVSGFYYILN